MSPLSQGTWDIESVVVNSETVTDCDGFEKLCHHDGQITIWPSELSFKVVEAEKRRLVLVSQEQIYFANIEQSTSKLKLSLTRPEFSETIEINSRTSDGTRVNAEREVVQV